MDSNETRLDAPDQQARAVAFESAVLAALGIAEEAPPIRAWAEAYRTLSKALIDRLGVPVTSGAFTYDRSDQALDAVWGLIYAARTFHIAHRLLTAHTPASGPFVEFGAGWGPFGLAAAVRNPHRSVVLIEAAEAPLTRARALFSAAGLAPPQTRPGLARPEDVPVASAIAVPFVLNEVVPPDGDEDGAKGARWVQRLLDRLQADGLLYLVEPGTRTASRRLQAVRDRLASHVVAPCPRTTQCPLLAVPQDWCHFSWNLPPGPLARRLADAAKRSWQASHFSWLLLSAEPTVGSEGARVLERRPAGKAKMTVRLCGPNGVETVVALRRHGEAFRHLETLPVGGIVRVPDDCLDRKGDGLRLTSAGDLPLLRPL